MEKSRSLAVTFFSHGLVPQSAANPCPRLLRFVLRHSVPSSESGALYTQVHKRGTWQVSVLWNVSGTAIAFGAPGRATGVRMGRRCTERMEACGDEASDSDGGRSTPDAPERAHYARPKILLHSIPSAENSGEQMIERSILGKHRRRCSNKLQGEGDDSGVQVSVFILRLNGKAHRRKGRPTAERRREERNFQSAYATSLWVGKGPLPLCLISFLQYSLILGTSSIIYACQVAGAAGAAGRFDSLPPGHKERPTAPLPPCSWLLLFRSSQ